MKEILRDDQAIYEKFKYMGDNEVESILIVFLDEHYAFKKTVMLGLGSENSVIFSKSMFAKEIVNSELSDKIILIHNHPGGDSTPSEDDKVTTNDSLQVCSLLGREFVNHLIIAKDEYHSSREEITTRHVYKIEER